MDIDNFMCIYIYGAALACGGGMGFLVPLLPVACGGGMVLLVPPPWPVVVVCWYVCMYVGMCVGMYVGMYVCMYVGR